MRWLVGLACVLALGLGSGCSFAFVEGPPPRHAEREWFDCTTSRLAPIADTLLTLDLLVTALLVAALADGGLTGNSGDGGDDSDADLLAGLLAVSAIPAGISAVHGFQVTAECDRAKDARNFRLIGAPSRQVRIPVSNAGCTADDDCKGMRICTGGVCAWPQ